MIKENTVYEVNGKTFTNREDAVKEEKKTIDASHVAAATKMHNVFCALQQVNNINLNNSLFDAYLEMKDEELKPVWFGENKYFNVFTLLLKSKGMKYNSFQGDERKEGYLKINIGKNVIETAPNVEEIIDFIKSNIKS